MTVLAFTRVFFAKEGKIIFDFCLFLTLYLQTLDTFLITTDLRGYFLTSKRAYLFIFFAADRFPNFENKSSRKTQKVFLQFYPFSFLSIFYLVSLMSGHIPHYWHSKRAQPNIF